MANKFQTLTEYIDNPLDVHNVGELIYYIPENLERVQRLFDEYGIDITEESESYDTYTLFLVYEAKRSPDQRLTTSKMQRENNIFFHELIIDKLKPIADDPYFCRIIGLKHDVMKAQLQRTETALATFLEHNKRAGQVRSIKNWLSKLLPFLASNRLGQTKRINFIYDLFVEFDVPYDENFNYGASTFDSHIGPKAQKDRIRKWEEEIMRAYKDNSS